MKDIFYRIKQQKDKFHEKINENLRDRIQYEANQTLKVVKRLESKGFSDKEILREIEKSLEMPKKEYENN